MQSSTVNVRTDLAIEVSEALEKERVGSESGIPGVSVQKFQNTEDEIEVTRVIIENEEGEKEMGKAKGTYITIESPYMQINDPDAHANVIKVFAKELMSLLPKTQHKNVLVVGLGNRDATPDALGPKVANKVVVTRHIGQKLPWQIDESVCELSAITPGVMGVTGIETSEIISGVVDKIKPDYVLVVDALGARNAGRVNTTIQINNTGIEPGAGIGNKRKAITHENMGCPVIAIGVPTVVDAATLVSDMMDLLIESMLGETEDEAFYKMLERLSKQEKYLLVKEVLYPHIGNMFVTPKEIDEVIEYLSTIIANGINIAVHPGITTEDINRFKY
ncbi:MAG TPA: GPR endopeptidase [Epulopiscium sp.]|nr:GPR endopeptidase [Candidatus Epulonipiscium sp.]